MKILSFLLALFILTPALSYADDHGPKTIPTNLELMDETGAKRSFEDLTGENGLILIFHRSAKWCPFCQKQLINMNAQRQVFEDKGYNIAAISYDSVKELSKFDNKRDISYPLLSDEGSKTIQAFGILNEKHKAGSFAYGVPHPTIYVVNKDKSITATLAEEGYRKRPTAEAVLEVLN